MMLQLTTFPLPLITTADFAVLGEEEASEEQQDGATTEEGAATNEANRTNGEGGSENGTSENGDGQNAADGQTDQKVGEGDEDEQDEDDGEEGCDGSDNKEKPSGISKYFTVSYRKIKRGIAKQRVDEYEFMGVQQ